MEYVAAILFFIKILLCAVPPVAPAPSLPVVKPGSFSSSSSDEVTQTHYVGEGL